MRFSILASLALLAVAHASPLVPRNTPIRSEADFSAASPADRLAFLMGINPANVNTTEAQREAIAQDPGVKKMLGGRTLTNEGIVEWLKNFQAKHKGGKQ
ncbi:hypothetical protein MSAN_01311100 [Mycena sanguinolenta]|uniref:RxLR effector protein n=1 Tax=Mycena sanguinolenta TaxID=230812 RepID=A0A8H6YDU1_9AGAR|nr:hypothetical protein MSAN_01311100 [Mycena sanguinolenta]